MFKTIRIVVLLLILAAVWTAQNSQKNVARDWQGTLDIQIVPIVADQQSNTRRYVQNLKQRQFDEIARYFVGQARRYGKQLNYAFDLSLAEPIDSIPPQLPAHGASRLNVALWSLKLRWWAWRNQPNDHHSAQIRMYVLYQSPAKEVLLPHSTGLQKGLLGLINARAYTEYRGINSTIIAHELLHVLGASDKYDLSNGQPIYPTGYAQPDRRPLHPQGKAELMARAIAVAENKHLVAEKLGQTLIGNVTAAEIGWKTQ